MRAGHVRIRENNDSNAVTGGLGFVSYRVHLDLMDCTAKMKPGAGAAYNYILIGATGGAIRLQRYAIVTSFNRMLYLFAMQPGKPSPPLYLLCQFLHRAYARLDGQTLPFPAFVVSARCHRNRNTAIIRRGKGDYLMRSEEEHPVALTLVEADPA